MSGKYLSPKKIEQIYGIEAKTIYWWVRDRKVPYTKIGKSILIPQTELERFLDNNTVQPVYEDDYVVPEEIL